MDGRMCAQIVISQLVFPCFWPSES